GHSQLKTGHPVRSAIHKQLNGRLVLRWVTTWESLLLYVLQSIFVSCLYWKTSVHRVWKKYSMDLWWEGTMTKAHAEEEQDSFGRREAFYAKVDHPESRTLSRAAMIRANASRALEYWRSDLTTAVSELYIVIKASAHHKSTASCDTQLDLQTCRGSSIGRACGSYHMIKYNLKVAGSSPAFGYS
ncbi:hypothetical protein KCU78_g14920, partial [Aureobasidium melanogenum]